MGIFILKSRGLFIAKALNKDIVKMTKDPSLAQEFYDPSESSNFLKCAFGPHMIIVKSKKLKWSDDFDQYANDENRVTFKSLKEELHKNIWRIEYYDKSTIAINGKATDPTSLTSTTRNNMEPFEYSWDKIYITKKTFLENRNETN